jgi:hypothetical protein
MFKNYKVVETWHKRHVTSFFSAKLYYVRVNVCSNFL